MATETKITVIMSSVEARQILVERIIQAAVRGMEFDLDPVDLLREATEKVNGDAMVIVNRMPEAV